MDAGVWGEVVTYGSCALGGLALLAIRVFRQKIRKKLIALLGKYPNYPESKEVGIDKTVYGLLVELRTSANADRACLFQFHNGNLFSNLRPIWRVSCTHESCKAGVSHEMHNQQNLLSSSLFEVMEPLFTKGSVQPGVTELTDKRGTRILGICVEKMPNCFARSLLMSQGVLFVYIIPIFIGEAMIGFTDVCFCSPSDLCDSESDKTVLLDALERFAAQAPLVLKYK